MQRIFLRLVVGRLLFEEIIGKMILTDNGKECPNILVVRDVCADYESSWDEAKHLYYWNWRIF